MSDNDKAFIGSIPDIYDAYLVPLIFEAAASDLARRVATGPCAAVLETAAGSGVVTRALAPLLAADAQYAVSDLNPPMLARAQARQPDDPRLGWHQADAQDLQFEDNSFDVVCCQFGVMFFPDKPRAYAEALRVLRPGGRFLFNVWDDIIDNEFADVVTQVATRLLPEAPPRFMARTPHGHGDADQLRRDLATAGFTQIDIETVAGTSTAPDASHPAIAYVQGTPLRGEIEPHGPDMLHKVTKAATAEIARRWGEGPVSAKIQGKVICAS
ncbi:class I SAM-dependent methyltransferase [Sedimentitalea todarodis]|uniref:Class I SAM-dependent methyltransferase n=1 Tax=Sedimentitalea todarodis TaxID=1631240 RepID=A0ABU3VCU7_9RHOB|nr:class I SAM-dependent methyltransferase [Sedimentitalea todarodis]MDU9003996.1 class I SAM-dependent methyltransferase [Sedimentitalea todarodis]